ncbi:TauD/TfdA family dioxygenase [Magnetovirga frankeli]|uniref:TauD/TfdA family dioxygenase n=1 Tax=Magnetovirga frankeli TaxID=947516 RepID=UPI0012938090|nr:TauD/TfdA family dioxygenase [gamma proteobacterium SS-5]
MHSQHPFDLTNESAYGRWRDDKLRQAPQRAEELIVEIQDPAQLTPAEQGQMRQAIQRANMVLFACQRPFTDHASLSALSAQFGLKRLDNHLCTDEDGISNLQVSDQGHKRHYIPYTNRKINWHTDGYYNPLDKQIHGLALYCAQQAAEGGGNKVLDHELAYIRLRDANPDFIRALSQPDAMGIPANDVEGEVLRQATFGPVFSVDASSGTLHMRYTARKRNIIWPDDATTQAALTELDDLFSEDAPPIFSVRLEPGQGLLCNNLLHYRDAFTDDPQRGQTRLYFRARYYDRIV